ncbi:hypothetical protein V6N11_081026 [Hibiscus sabdariffa]|uniref:Uncharacterized protein n=1 Tax=Hibiscus sabdariffa TaxID=183260 RepID=A0ABR2QIP7_9ROSI
MVPFVSRTEVKTEVVIGLTIKSLNDDKSRLQLQLQDHQKETRDFWAQVRLLSEWFRNMKDQQHEKNIDEWDKIETDDEMNMQVTALLESKEAACTSLNPLNTRQNQPSCNYQVPNFSLFHVT